MGRVLSLKSFPIGFRFRPTDEELVDHYLRRKIDGNHKVVQIIKEVDVCKCEPWDLPGKSAIQSNDPEWFFFCPQDRKYPNGLRLNRATAAGYWKATGKDRKIKSGRNQIGMKKTLVFYTGRAPKGRRTGWVMHEYRATLKELDGTRPGQGAFVLCRLFKKEEEKFEVSNDDDVELTVLSPSTTISGPEEAHSEPVLGEVNPAFERSIDSGEKDPTKIGGSASEDPVVEAPPNDVNQQLEDNIQNLLNDFTQESPYMEMFSLLPMHAELGSPSPLYIALNDFNNYHSGVQRLYGTNEHDADINDEFFDSVFENGDENSHPDICTPVLNPDASWGEAFLKEAGLCSDSDPEVVQTMDYAQMETNPGGCGTQTLNHSIHRVFQTQSHTEAVQNAADGTGIRIRTRQPQKYPPPEPLIQQGAAPQRLRLQRGLNVGSVCCNARVVNSIAHDSEAKPAVLETRRPTGMGVSKVGISEDGVKSFNPNHRERPSEEHKVVQPSLSSSWKWWTRVVIILVIAVVVVMWKGLFFGGTLAVRRNQSLGRTFCYDSFAHPTCLKFC